MNFYKKARSFFLYSAILAVPCFWFASAAPAQAFTILGTGTGSLVGSDLTDIGDDGVEGSYAPPSLAGFDAEFFSSDEPGFGGGEFAFNVFDNLLGGGNDKWCCGTAFPQIVGADFSSTLGPIVLTRFTLSSANDVPGRDPTVWKIQGSNDMSNWIDIYDHASGGSDWVSRLQVNSYSPADGDTFLTTQAFTAFRLTVTATGLLGGAFFQVGELELFGDQVSISEPGILAIFGLGLAGLGFARRKVAQR